MAAAAKAPAARIVLVRMCLFPSVVSAGDQAVEAARPAPGEVVGAARLELPAGQVGHVGEPDLVALVGLAAVPDPELVHGALGVEAVPEAPGRGGLGAGGAGGGG